APDVIPDWLGAPPRQQVAFLLSLHNQRVELRHLVGREPLRLNRLAWFRSLPLRSDGSHDRLGGGRDRRTMILSRSRVNPGHQPTRSCLEKSCRIGWGDAKMDSPSLGAFASQERHARVAITDSGLLVTYITRRRWIVCKSTSLDFFPSN